MQPISQNSVRPVLSESRSQPISAPIIGTSHADVAQKSPIRLSESEVNKAISTANTALKLIASNLEFSRDESTGKSLVRIIDTGTKEVIRQFPTTEMLSISKAIDNFKGLLIHQKA